MRKMPVLITGVTGFAGGHLAEFLLSQGRVEIAGTSRRAKWPDQWRHLSTKIKLHPCDLSSRVDLEALIRDLCPNEIYHLAGYAHVGESFKEPDAAWSGNLTATRRLYETIEAYGEKVRIVAIGSGQVYGDTDSFDPGPDEQAPFRPLSPYAASKAAADLAGYQFSRAAGLDVVRVRPFNHIGPRQSAEYAVAHFAQQIAAIELGQQPALLETGNLAPRRDLTDVRDMVRAYALLMERGRSGEVYNAGSGEAHSMQDVVDHLLSLARVKIEVRQASDLVRTTETNVVCANASKLRRETGWSPQYSFRQTLADILTYFRDVVSRRKTDP
jgi:GDP-4-dehydro-6-deoxy-D-mannose reductase